MTTVTSLEQRYREVKERVAAAAERSGRSPEQILTVAVTKYTDLDRIRDLILLGHQDFGESRVQQLVQRAAIIEEMLARHQTMPGVSAARQGESAVTGAMSPPRLPKSVRWHLIGHLQRNKVKKAVEVARLIHSVDSLRLVEEIQSVAMKRDTVVDVLVQVNCSGEASKYGCAVPAAMHLCEQIDTLVHMRVRGIMTMAPYSDDPEDSRPVFERCNELYTDIVKEGIGEGHFNILSMGMSNDYEVAIECGANLVRIGSAIFGDDAPHDHTEDEPG